MRQKVENLKRFYENKVDGYIQDIINLQKAKRKAPKEDRWDYEEEIKIIKGMMASTNGFIYELNAILKED